MPVRNPQLPAGRSSFPTGSPHTSVLERPLTSIKDTTHPRLRGKDLLTLLRAPMLHLRHLNRALRSLMDATPDDHSEMRCLVDVLSTLSTLADQCQGYHCWSGVNLHLQELIMQMVWTEPVGRDFGIEQSWRKLVETGWLLLPRTVSSPHGPGGDEMGPHGTSEYSELLDVFVVILDNCGRTFALCASFYLISFQCWFLRLYHDGVSGVSSF